jgi:poly(U)-specific endoribonuclease
MGAVKYTWNEKVKRSGSFFVGTSPEFDFALYTVCLLTRATESHVQRACKVSFILINLSLISYSLNWMDVSLK